MEQEQQYPTEVIDLPSRGLVYSEDSKLSQGKIELRYPTLKEEDILMSQNLTIKGLAVRRFVESIIHDKTIKLNDLTTGDYNNILIGSRILAYGPEYHVIDKRGNKIPFDLTNLSAIDLDETKLISKHTNEFSFTSSTGTEFTYKLLTIQDEDDIEQLMNKLYSSTPDQVKPILSTRFEYMILSVNGETSKQKIKTYVNSKMPTRESLEFRRYLDNNTPGVKTTVDIDGRECNFRIGVDFFWP